MPGLFLHQRTAFHYPSSSVYAFFPSEVGVGDDNVLRYRCTCHIPKSTSDARHASFFLAPSALTSGKPECSVSVCCFCSERRHHACSAGRAFFFSTETGAPDHHHGHKLNIYSYVSQSQIVFMAFKNSVITLLKTFVRRWLFPFFACPLSFLSLFFLSTVCDLSAVYVFTSTAASTHSALKAMDHGYEATGVPIRRSCTISTQNGSINDRRNKKKLFDSLNNNTDMLQTYFTLKIVYACALIK